MSMMLTINIHHPNQYDIIYMVQQGLDVEIDMMLEELQCNEGVIIDDDDLEGDVDDKIEENKGIMSMMMTTEDEQLNLILSKLVDRDEDVKSKSSCNVEKPLHFVSYAAAISAASAVVAMTTSLTDPAGVDPDDDEGVLTDEDDGDDLEGNADNEMEKDEDDNGDDGNEGGVGIPVEIVGYGMHELVTHIDLEQVLNAATLDQ
ncbi:hypothetical protein FF1_037136 [Malus domestica]